MAITPEWIGRINRWRETMPRLLYRELGRIAFDGYVTRDQLRADQAERRRFVPMRPGTRWGAKWEYAWFRADIVLPKSAAGERIVLKTDLSGNESAVYINGHPAGARDNFHHELTLAAKARGGEKFHVLIEAYAGHGPQDTAGGGGPNPHGHIPSCGMITVRRAKAVKGSPLVTASSSALENELLRITFNKRGEIAGIYDKEHGVEFAKAACNAFRLYKDVPSNFDAWNLDSIYKQQEVPLADAVTVLACSEGPVLGMVRLTRTIGQSKLEQEIVLRAGSRRIEFRTRIDWRESHKLLKVNFPVTVKAEDALHEIQFGHVRRPTHSSLPYDGARFEVCNQKWTALAEENRGAAVLNDCKYGVNVDGSSINLTLLKSPLMPDMTADKGLQEFTYAFYCWTGAFKDSGVIKEAYELNMPVAVTPGKAPRSSLFSVSYPSIIIETIKPAEDGSGDLVVRLYEASRSSVICTLITGLPVKRVVETNMLEHKLRELKSKEGEMSLSFRPFEIKTLRFAM